MPSHLLCPGAPHTDPCCGCEVAPLRICGRFTCVLRKQRLGKMLTVQPFSLGVVRTGTGSQVSQTQILSDQEKEGFVLLEKQEPSPLTELLVIWVTRCSSKLPEGTRNQAPHLQHDPPAEDPSTSSLYMVSCQQHKMPRVPAACSVFHGTEPQIQAGRPGGDRCPQ